MRHRIAVLSVWVIAAAGGLALSTRISTTHHHKYTPVPSVKSFRPLPHLDGAPPVDVAVPFAKIAPSPEPASARDAVSRYLAAEVARDDTASYPFVSTAGTDRYPTLDSWKAGRDRVLPTSFVIRSEAPRDTTTTEVTADVTYQPAIDAFAGFVPGRAVDVFVARQQDGHWRVDPSPASVDPQLPADGNATTVVQSWINDLSSCDTDRAAQFQASSPLYGPLDSLATPCRMRTAWTADRAQQIESAFDAPDYVAAFGSGVTAWARVVNVHTGSSALSVVVGPMGDDWKVLGVLNKPIGSGRG